ncbi:hypothetical protein [Sphingomonas elodea]|uniref:hypothetical protein n=1 Tax=Sphingomonas elodea TaxID=179878 RepID=UPI0002630CE8|nr:hypothetical protein [Sphingomonas elodea]
MTANPPRERTEHERRVHAANRQGTLPREGRVDALAGQDRDGIPMTGEEDPLVEVEGFSDTVCDFAASERGDDAEPEAHPS